MTDSTKGRNSLSAHTCYRVSTRDIFWSLWLGNKLPHIYCIATYKQHPFISSARQKSGHSATGFSAQGFLRLKSGCVPGCIPLWKLWERSHPQVHSDCWQTSVPSSCRPLPIPCWLSAGGPLGSQRPLHASPRGPSVSQKRSLSHVKCLQLQTTDSFWFYRMRSNRPGKPPFLKIPWLEALILPVKPLPGRS